MSRKSYASVYFKKSVKNEDVHCLQTTAKSQANRNVYESALTFPPRGTKSQFSGSTPVLPQLLQDLEHNPIFQQQKQRNRRSKSIDFLNTKPISLLPDVHNRRTEIGKVHYDHYSQRKSLSASSLPVSYSYNSRKSFLDSI